jgi:protein subunit release factor B
MAIRPEKQRALVERMKELAILEKDIKERFIHGSGRGGQKVNKSSTCVYLKHEPTGIEVKCSKDRSREINRFLARRELCDKFERKVHGTKSPQDLKVEKLRKQKKRRGRRSSLKGDQSDLPNDQESIKESDDEFTQKIREGEEESEQ